MIGPHGTFGGTFTVRATVTVNDGADSFTGAFSAQLADRDGQVLLSLNATVQATRIGVASGHSPRTPIGIS